MKKRYYRQLWKSIGIMLQIILTVVFVSSIFLLSALEDEKIIDMDNLTNENYVESNYYADLFEDKMNELTHFLRERSQFEEDGVYDSEKLVNIGQYAHRDMVQKSYEVSIEKIDLENTEVMIQAANAKRMFQTYYLSDLVAWSKEGYVQYGNQVEEKYTPVAGILIADGEKEGLISETQAAEIYQELIQTLNKIGDEETAYKKALNEFENSDSNLKYRYIGDDNVTYTNIDGEIDTENLLDYAKQQGSYVYINDNELKFRTNVSGMETYYYNHLDGKIAGMAAKSVLTVSVDDTFPYADEFTDGEKEFSKLHPWGMTSIVFIVISLLGWMVSFVYITMTVGHVPQDDKIHLSWPDKIKTEIFFAVFVLISLLVIILSLRAASFEWDIPGILILVGMVALIYDGIFLVFYTSMIRRLKAEVLWENSFLNWIIVSVQRMVGTWKASVRVLLIYLLNVVLALLCAYGFFAERIFLCGLVLLLILLIEGVLYLRAAVQKQEIRKGIKKITDGDLAYKIPLEHLHSDNLQLAEAINNIGDGLHLAVQEKTKNERMKADLITNVSHDIKTPLTSIINYVNLMKMEKPESERMQNYIHVLEEKSQRLRQLTEDLVEASRISSGNISLQLTRINFVELIYQTAGEFNEKFEAKDLTVITKLPKESVVIMADGRRIWRIVENLYNNVAKYALAHTRVYVNMEIREQEAEFSIKNISEQPLDLTSVDLTERFTRGDESRTTEGSGLGLSIARNLTTIMGGEFEIKQDGDLFAAVISFPLA